MNILARLQNVKIRPKTSVIGVRRPTMAESREANKKFCEGMADYFSKSECNRAQAARRLEDYVFSPKIY